MGAWFCMRWPGLALVSWISDSDERPMVGTGCGDESRRNITLFHKLETMRLYLLCGRGGLLLPGSVLVAEVEAAPTFPWATQNEGWWWGSDHESMLNQ